MKNIEGIFQNNTEIIEPKANVTVFTMTLCFSLSLLKRVPRGQGRLKEDIPLQWRWEYYYLIRQ